MQKQYGDVVRLPLGRRKGFLITRPEDVQRILLDDSDRFPKPVEIKEMRPLLGNGLLTSEGEAWKRQRRLSIPAFHHHRLEGFSTWIIEAAEQMLNRWEGIAHKGHPIDMCSEMARVTLGIIGRIMFSVDLEPEFEKISRSLTQVLKYLHYRTWSPIPVPDRFPLPGHSGYQKGMAYLNSVVYRIIDGHFESATDRGDLLSMLLRPHPETGERFSREELRDQVMTIMLAGHETTANLLSWTWYLLDQNPTSFGLFQTELKKVLGEKDRSITFEDAPALAYTGRIIDECLRLYPTANAVYRAPIDDQELGGYRIPKKSLVILSSYVTQRRSDLWAHPDVFDPDRFLPERRSTQHRYAYYPFGGGPRICIGMSLALLEAKLILATTAQRFRPRLVPGHKVVPIPATTLRMRYGLRMTLDKR